MAIKSDFDVGAVAISSTLTLDDTPGAAISAVSGLLYGWAIINTTAAVAYIQVFDVAAVGDVTLGTTTPRFVIPLAANGVYHFAMKKPIPFSTGIVVFSTTTTTGSTGAASNAVWFFA